MGMCHFAKPLDQTWNIPFCPHVTVACLLSPDDGQSRHMFLPMRLGGFFIAYLHFFYWRTLRQVDKIAALKLTGREARSIFSKMVTNHFLPLPVHNMVLSACTINWLIYEMQKPLSDVLWRVLGIIPLLHCYCY